MFTQELKSVTLGSQNVRKIKTGTFLESNSSNANNNTNFLAKLTVINRDLTHLNELREKHECSYQNPNRKNCSHVCLLTGDDFAGACHCPDGLTLDEDGMTCIKLSTCSADQFTCSDGNCISQLYICDGVPDCSHNEDEFNCNQATCSEETFKCESNGVCIPRK